MSCLLTTDFISHYHLVNCIKQLVNSHLSKRLLEGEGGRILPAAEGGGVPAGRGVLAGEGILPAAGGVPAAYVHPHPERAASRAAPPEGSAPSLWQ